MKKINNLQEAIKICECLEIPGDNKKVQWRGEEVGFWEVSAMKRDAWRYIQERVHAVIQKTPDTKTVYKFFEQLMESKEAKKALTLLQNTYDAINIDEFNELLEADVWNVSGWSVTMMNRDETKERFKFAELIKEKYELLNNVLPCTEEKKLMSEVLSTDRIQHIFAAAIGRGWMKENNNGGYEWLGVSGKKERGYLQQWAYFCGVIFGYRTNAPQTIPSKDLEQTFGIDGFASKLGKVYGGNNIQHWRQPIDELIEKSTR